MNSNKKDLSISTNKFHKNQISQTSQLQDISLNSQLININSNGFSNRPTLYQVMPVLYVILMSVETVGLIIIISKDKFKIIYGLGYTVLLIVVTVLWYITTKIDPTDSIQLLYRTNISKKKQMKSSYFRFFCHICQTCVSKSAFHCRSCNRCVDCFDHHCKWLNNCIGAKNYLQFFILIITTQIFILLHTIINTLDIIKTIKQANQPKNYHWIFYIQIPFIAINIIILGFNTILVTIHIYLIIGKKSTIQLMMQKRKISKIHPIQQHNNIQQNINKVQNQKISIDKLSKHSFPTPIFQISSASTGIKKQNGNSDTLYDHH